jgi:chromatin segregation and condensation protein Rec8/ScpA/Scc1 (kleisin family)
MAAETDPGIQQIVQQPAKDIEFWRDRDFSPLVNHEDLKKVAKDDPWQYEVSSRLRSFLMRMESRKVVNFRVSGIVLHSASVLCRAKSQTMVDKGAEMQESLAETGDVADETADDGSVIDADGMEPCTIDELAFTADGDIKPEAIAAGNIDIDKVIDSIASGRGSMSRFLSREKLARFNTPKRVVAKPLTMTDLSLALNDALAGKFRRRLTRAEVKQVTLPNALKNSYGDGLKIETLIPEIDAKVREVFKDSGSPTSFVMLFEDLSTIYIVKTFMAILHMINRKMVEVWQKGDGEILIVPFGKTNDVFSSKAETAGTSTE